MKKKAVLSFFVGLFIICLIIAGITQAFENHTVTKQSLIQQMLEMHSSMQESKKVLSLYGAGTLTSVYTDTHLQYLNQNMLQATALLQQGYIAPADRSTVKRLIALTTDFSLSLHDVMQAGRDKKTIEQSLKTIGQLEKQLEGLEKKYE